MSIISTMRFINIILDFLLPSTCLSCNELGDYVCQECRREKIQTVDKQKCHICKKESFSDSLVHERCKSNTSLDGVIVCVFYNDFVEKIIAEIKYKLYFRTADFLTSYFVDSIKKYDLEIDCLVPIPLHRRKIWERGFNQAELFSQKVSKEINIPTRNLIVRKRNTKTQVGMNRKERMKNLKDVFDIKSEKGIGKYKNICLVDDVMTTGTTLEESAKVLKQGGVKKVYGLVFARG